MKRALFFWPTISAVVASLVWAGLCGFVIGVPFDVSAGWFRSPALLLGWPPAGSAIRLLGSSVSALWRVAPYCRVPRSLPEWEGRSAPLEMYVAIIGYDAPGPPLVAIHFRPRRAPVNIPGIGLSAGEVLLYVVLIPGVHCALGAFAMALVVVMLTRVVLRGLLPLKPGLPGADTRADPP